MDALIGIRGEDFILVASSLNNARSVVVMKHDQNRMYPLSDTKMLLSVGDSSSSMRFSELMQRDYKLYSINNNVSLSMHSTAHLTRSRLAKAIRSRNPYLANVLLAGVDSDDEKAKLYWLDYLGTMVSVPCAAHGYASYFVYSIMDKNWRKDISVSDACKIMKMCVDEVKKRLVISVPKFCVKLISKHGIRDINLDESQNVGEVSA